MQSNYLEVIQDADLIHLIHQVVAEKTVYIKKSL